MIQDIHDVLKVLTLSLLIFPAGVAAVLIFVAWFDRARSEATVNALVATGYTATVAAATALLALMASQGVERVVVPLGAWVAVGHYHFDWTLIADHLSVPFALFSSMLVALIGAFSRRYLHLERGYLRFYLLMALFGAGVELVVLAGSLDLVFFAWEIVGLTSALLIAFFNERRRPVEHGFLAFVTYRLCDIGLLGAAVWLHHTVGTSAVTAAPTATTPWASFAVPAGAAATAAGLMLLWAAMGKSAQVPLGGWLPRAMEGPTPSSAIFYGAISIHLGPYLLLRAGSILDHAPMAAAAVTMVGAVTALHATFVGRVQSDIKSALAYASMTQVGLIFVEIGLGCRYFALAHIVGHAAIRSLQILRSPSLLHDHHHLEQAMGAQLPKTGGHLERLVPDRLQPWLYRHALERGYLEGIIKDYALGGFLRLFRRLDALDRAWSRAVAQSGPQAARWSRAGRDAREAS